MRSFLKKSRQRLWSVLILCLAALLPIEAHTQGPSREADKAEGIQRVLGQRKFELERAGNTPGKPFCEEFLRDFSRLKNIVLIEPDVKADSYDDAVWLPYRSRCTNMASELFDSYHCEPRNAEIIEQFPKEERDDLYRSSCRHYRGATKFKHYLVDINNSPKDGKEHVFYYERSRGPLNGPAAQQHYANGGYSVIDFDRCEFKGFAEAHDPYEDSQPPRLLQNQSGIIKYKGKHYIFDLSELITIESDLKKPNFRLHLSGYAKFGREAVPRLGPLCVYGTPITQPK